MSYLSLSSRHTNMSEFSEDTGSTISHGKGAGAVVLIVLGSLMTSLGFTVVGLNASQHANVDTFWQMVIASVGVLFVVMGLIGIVSTYKSFEKNFFYMIALTVVGMSLSVTGGYFWGKSIFEDKLHEKNKMIEKNSQSPPSTAMSTPMPIPNLVGVWRSPNTSVWLDIFSPTAGKEKNLNNPATEDLFEIKIDRFVGTLSRREPVRDVDFTFTYKDGRLANSVNYKFDIVDGSLTNLMTSQKFTRVAS